MHHRICGEDVMHDFYYTKLLVDESKFKPRVGLLCVDVLDSEAAGHPVVLERDITEDQVQDWLAQDDPPSSQSSQDGNQGRVRSRLRVLIGSPEQHSSDAEILPLPMSRETFEAVRTTWNMPKELLRMMLSTLPIATPIQTLNDLAQPVNGLMMRSARSRDWNFCLGLVHNAETGTVHAIVNGLQGEEIAQLLTCLRESRSCLSEPMLLPIFLLELKVHYFAVLLENRAERIEGIELDTGMKHEFSLSAKRKEARHREREKLLKDLNFDEITQKLTGGTGTLAFCDMTFASSLRALERVCLVKERIRCLRNHRPDRINAAGANAVDTRIAYLRELIVGAQAHSGVLSARTKAQVQTVYSMIGQKDNKLNIETAAASRDIAEISLRHNTAMKEMAVDSRNIAILTRQDSTDMRIIAVVTLLFLPGTFMAALFSADFFDFSPRDTNEVVSKWIWLYFVLTGAATLVVFGGWYLFSHRQNKKIVAAMNTDARPPLMSDRDDLESGITALPAPPDARPLWTARSMSTGEMELVSSFGRSADALK
ncbi:hypothetical protein A1O7_02789 [Cladophialophora yegresii CBS 114405]|uniref:Uncharacterized protein n=1 Tax=Cladophialophora yegresii CBS 114405 TaxID=1182544 RepID=W9WBK6_9EURO|nr:uncharacterized protein A1O7_02789 [Cladophialophora yegresii CBS 114405]EXJ62355.1 hypothetical protein A1O7_02789 [Cladophialophora yegresii CBS 114405]